VILPPSVFPGQSICSAYWFPDLFEAAIICSKYFRNFSRRVHLADLHLIILRLCRRPSTFDGRRIENLLFFYLGKPKILSRLLSPFLSVSKETKL